MAQAECLLMEGVMQGGNLVYCAPTSGGKSLVAEVCMLRAAASTRKPTLLVLPFRALCEEKVLCRALKALECALSPSCHQGKRDVCSSRCAWKSVAHRC